MTNREIKRVDEMGERGLTQPPIKLKQKKESVGRTR